MSSYINFYINKGDEYIACGSYSRNSVYYRCLGSLVPYDDGKEVTSELLNTMREIMNENISETKAEIATLEETKRTIATFNNTVEEKADMIDKVIYDINLLKEDLDDYDRVIRYTYFLGEIINPYMNEDVKILCGIEYYPNYTED